MRKISILFFLTCATAYLSADDYRPQTQNQNQYSQSTYARNRNSNSQVAYNEQGYGNYPQREYVGNENYNQNFQDDRRAYLRGEISPGTYGAQNYNKYNKRYNNNGNRADNNYHTYTDNYYDPGYDEYQRNAYQKNYQMGDWDYQQNWRFARDAYLKGETQPEVYREAHPYGKGGIGYDDPRGP